GGRVEADLAVAEEGQRLGCPGGFGDVQGLFEQGLAEAVAHFGGGFGEGAAEDGVDEVPDVRVGGHVDVPEDLFGQARPGLGGAGGGDVRPAQPLGQPAGVEHGDGG